MTFQEIIAASVGVLVVIPLIVLVWTATICIIRDVLRGRK